MAGQWIEAQGDAAWELDALEPNVLFGSVEESILKHPDKDVLQKRNELPAENREKIRLPVQDLLNRTG